MVSEPDLPPVSAPRRGRSPSQMQQSTENRKVIVHNALEFFARYGYTKTTLQAVAERVGLSRTGLLHHFHSKEGLFVEAIEEGKQWAQQQAQDPEAAGGGLSGIRAMHRFLGSADDATHVQFVQTLQGEAVHEDAPEHVVNYARLRLAQVESHALRCLKQARDQGEIGDVDIAPLATLIAGTINGLQMKWLLDRSVDAKTSLNALVDLLACTAPPKP